MDMLFWLVPVGVLSGTLTTVAGMGGGFLMVLIFATWMEPRTALALTAPALMLGNLHRVWIYRQHLVLRLAGVFVLGAIPGGLAGSFFAVWMPQEVVRWLLLGVTALAVARALDWFPISLSPGAMAPGGFLAGFLSASSGAGIFVAPILMAGGVHGHAYVATAAASAFVIHVTRISVYGASGLIDQETLAISAVLALSIVVGNLVGKALRAPLGERATQRIAYIVLVSLVVLALGGVGRSG